MKKNVFILLVILLFATVLRTFELSHIPYGMRNDEAFIFVNGYTIRELGKDIYGNGYPLIFRPTSGITTAPIPIYLAAASFKLFGYSLVAAKIPTVIASLLGIIFAYLFILEITKDERLSLLTAAILTVSPWHLYVSRTGFESMIAYTGVIAGWYFFLRMIHKKSGLLPVFLSFTIAAFSYKAVNIVLLASSFIFFLYAWYTGKHILKSFIVIIFSTLLLLAVWVINVRLFHDTYSTDILREQSIQVENQVNNERKESSAPFWVQRIASNKLTVRLKTLSDYYFNFYSMRGLFIAKGDQDDSYSLAGHGLLYLIELLLVPFGVYSLYRTSKKNVVLLSNLLLVTPLPAVISSPIYPLRCLIGVYLFAAFSASGIKYGFGVLSKKFQYGKSIAIIGTIAYGVSVLAFLYQYFFRFPVVGFDVWQGYDMKAYQYVGNASKKVDQITMVGIGENEFLQYAFWNKLAAKEILHVLQFKKNGILAYNNIAFINACPNESEKHFPVLKNHDILVAREGCYKNYLPNDSIVFPKGLKVYWNIFLYPATLRPTAL